MILISDGFQSYGFLVLRAAGEATRPPIGWCELTCPLYSVGLSQRLILISLVLITAC